MTVRGFEGLRDVPFAALTGAMSERETADQAAEADVVRRLRGWLRSLAGAGTWVLVDDADLLDPPSSGLLSYSAQTEGLCLLVTMRAGRDLPGDLERLALHQSWSTIALAPWTVADVVAALTSTLGDPIDPALAGELHELAAGVPLVLRELLVDGIERDAIHVVDGRWTGRASVASPDAASRLLGRRIPTVGPALAVLQTVAIAGQVRPALLDRLASQDVLVELDARGLLEFPMSADQPFVRLAHPMIADALRAGLDPESRRVVLARIVAAALDLEPHDDRDQLQLFRWALEIEEPLPAETLRAGYFVALGHLDYALAADIAGVLDGRTPTAEAAFFHALALARAGRFDEAVAIADQARGLARDDDEVTALARLLVRLHSPVGHTLGYLGGRPEIAADVAAWADDRLAGASFGSMVDAFTRFVAGDVAGAVAAAERVAVAPGPPGVREEADQLLVMIAPIAGRFDLARTSQSRLAAVTERRLDLPAVMGSDGARISLLMYDGRLLEARAEDDRSFAAAEHALAYDEMMNAAAQRGMRNYLIGDIDASVASLELALQYRIVPASRSLLIFAVLASAYARRGEGERALGVLERADLERAPFPAVVLQVEYDHLAAVTRAIVGVGAGHEATIRGVTEHAQATGNPWLHAMSRLSLVRLGVATRADGDAARATFEAVDAPLIRAVAEVVVAAVDQDVARLEAVADRLAEMDAHLLEVDALVAAHAACPEADDRVRARLTRRLTTAVAACPGLAQVPVSVARSSADLTVREREIAELAATAMSSKAIGERLGVSSRTVDNTLRRAYAKLGITGRAELAAALHR